MLGDQRPKLSVPIYTLREALSYEPLVEPVDVLELSEQDDFLATEVLLSVD